MAGVPGSEARVYPVGRLNETDGRGGEYDRADNFVQKAKAALRKIRAVYPALKLNYVKAAWCCSPR
jgi:hypothetical protein